MNSYVNEVGALIYDSNDLNLRVNIYLLSVCKIRMHFNLSKINFYYQISSYIEGFSNNSHLFPK